MEFFSITFQKVLLEFVLLSTQTSFTSFFFLRNGILYKFFGHKKSLEDVCKNRFPFYEKIHEYFLAKNVLSCKIFQIKKLFSCRCIIIKTAKTFMFLKNYMVQSFVLLHAYRPPVDLYLNFEKSSWKNQVRRTGFLACKNQFRN